MPTIFLNETFNDIMIEFLSRPQFYKFVPDVGFRRTTQGTLSPKFLIHNYAVRFRDDDAYFYRTRLKEAWDSHTKELNSKSPLSLGKEAYYTDSYYGYFIWQPTVPNIYKYGVCGEESVF